MRRVVITGIGIVSSIDNNAQEVTASLRESKSGIVFSEDYAEHGFRSQIHGAPNIDLTEMIDRYRHGHIFKFEFVNRLHT